MTRTEVITVSMREQESLKTIQAVVDGMQRPSVFNLELGNIISVAIHLGLQLVSSITPIDSDPARGRKPG